GFSDIAKHDSFLLLLVLPTVNSFQARSPSNGSLPCIMLVRICGRQYESNKKRRGNRAGNRTRYVWGVICGALLTSKPSINVLDTPGKPFLHKVVHKNSFSCA